VKPRLPGWITLAARRFSQFALVPIPDDIAQRLTVEQATDLASIKRAVAVVGLGMIVLLWLDFARAHGSAVQAGLFAGQAVTYAVMLRRSGKWLRDKHRGGNATAFIEDALMLNLVQGLLWAMLVIVSMQQADAAQRVLVYGVMVGIMTRPVLISPLRCGVAFWLPLAIGEIAALLASPPVDPFALTGVCAFALLTGLGMLFMNKRSTERAINAIRTELDRKVIQLLLRDFEENTGDWLWETNAAMELVNVSSRLAAVVNKPRQNVVGIFPYALLGDAARFDAQIGTPVHQLAQCLARHAPFRDIVVPVVIDGEERSWSLTGRPVLDRGGAFAGYHGVGSDVTRQRQSQEQIAFLARHDSLTKLANRVQFSEVLNQACANCDETGVALICLDLDDFKLVNDSHGHATGDAVLVAVGERIRGCLRERDLAARLGGDEFAVIVTTSDPEHASTVARRIIERASRPYHFDGQLVQIGVSVGIATAPGDSRTPDELMKRADHAMYRAKAEARGTFRCYDAEMDQRLQERRKLQSDLREALAKGEFSLEFQPIVDLRYERIVCAEALLRWRHPGRGQLSPADFVPIAEETGLIGPIGDWVIREACRAAAAWPDHVRVAVNLSPLQFRDAGLLGIIDQALAQTGLEPSRLELEITETTVLETNSQTVDTLWRLHGRGIRIALDDFGTGYSSLSYLRGFPFDKIKIDRSFIRDLSEDTDDAAIILAVIGLAKSMKMLVTAEGVETQEQVKLLKDFGCTQAQGFLFYEPVPAEAVNHVIATDDRLFDWSALYAKPAARSAAG
jgi:diguanylate cyclase (GGDEF)-like protein